MESNICPRCGENLVNLDEDTMSCPYCGATCTKESAVKAAYFLEQALKDKEMVELAGARRLLYAATHEPYPSKEKVCDAAKRVLSLYPEDFLANVYLHSHDRDPHRLNEFLARSEVSPVEAQEAFRWLLLSLHERVIGPLHDFLDRNLENEKRVSCVDTLNAEAEKVSQGIYEAGLPRNVFLCYSSYDMPKVVRLLDLLERNGFDCFAAFRNIRHGKGAQEEYLPLIKKAMKSCDAFLFLSSESSRDLSSDTMKVELPYLVNELPNKPRIEFLLEDYADTPYMAKKILKRAFPSQEYCTDEEDLMERIQAIVDGLSAARAQDPTPAEDLSEPDEPLAEPGSAGDEPKAAVPSIKIEAPQQSPEEIALKFEIEDGTLIRYLGNEEKVFIPDGVVRISDNAFGGCTSVTLIYIPKTVHFIGLFAFGYGNTRTERKKVGLFKHINVYHSPAQPASIIVDPENPVFDSRCNCNAIIHTGTNTLLKGCCNSIIPDTVTAIGEKAFYECSSLRQIAFPKGLESIGDYAFSESGISSIDFPDGLAYIGKGAFGKCPSLRSVVLPEGLEAIGDETFKDCKSLSRVAFPKGLSTIGKEAFFGCASLRSIALPEGLEAIDDETFKDCKSLSRVAFPKGLSTIGKEAFYGCTSLRSIALPEGLEAIGFGAFGLSTLQTVLLPSTLLEMSSNAFPDCIKRVYFGGDQNRWNEARFSSNFSYYTKVYFYSKELPGLEQLQNAWHFADGVPTPWW